jgi:hypothetical protein
MKLRKRTTVLGIVAFALTSPLRVSGQQRGMENRIIATDPGVRELLREGYDRSQTLRALINAIGGSRWRVFIQRGPCPARALTSCLLHFTGIFEGDPYLRILITFAGRHRDQVIASLAHEIQRDDAMRSSSRPRTDASASLRVALSTLRSASQFGSSPSNLASARSHAISRRPSCQTPARSPLRSSV